MLTKEPSRFEFLQVPSPWRELPEIHPQYRCRFLLEPYQGCALGCLYCFGATDESLQAAAPSLSRVGVKTNIVHALARELKKQDPQPVLIGPTVDPYQPTERRFRLTRRCLELLIAARYPIHVLTKSEDILNDLDLLAPYSQQGLAVVTVSVCSFKTDIAEWLEPFVPPPHKRLSLVKKLNRRGVVTGVALAPILPRLTDISMDLRTLFARIAASGAAYVLPTAFTGNEGGAQFFRFLEQRYPGLVAYYERALQEIAEGPDQWRHQVWEVLRYLADQRKIPLFLPTEGAKLPETLPAKFWES